MGIRVGIDLGTTFSVVAYINPETGKAEVIPNAEGNSVTPSVIAIKSDGTIVHGTVAKELQAEGYTEIAPFFKRCMGEDNYALPLCGKIYSAIDLSALLLHGLVSEAECQCKEKIDGVVITVPAYFKNREREATLKAGRQAGLNVLSIINEPTAAAFAYGLTERKEEQTILIYDLGGGTFDVTIARVNEASITILGSDGNHSLGGKDWDDAIVRWIADQFEEEYGLDILESPEQLSMLGIIAENAKKRLTMTQIADIVVYYQGKKGKYQLSRQCFEEISYFMLGETQNIINRLFKSFEKAEPKTPAMTWSDIDGVIFVGGSTRMRMIHDYVKQMTEGAEPLAGVNLDEAVALGAAIRANQMAEGTSNTRSSSKHEGFFGLGNAKAQKNTSPIRLIGSKKIIDATTHALGMISVSINGEQYINDILIEKNSPIPIEKTFRRQLSVGNHTGEMEVYLLQGDDHSPMNCDITGKYVFSNIMGGKDGNAMVDITYRYNENGVIEVSARQAESQQSLDMHIETVPDDMDWVMRSPKENRKTHGVVAGEVVLVVDLSGSMEGTPLAEAKKAMHKFIDETDLNVFKIGVMGVADSVRLYLAPTGKKEEIKRSVAAMQVCDCGGCNSAHPFDELQNLFSQTAEVRYAIVLADGRWEHPGKAIAAAHSCHQAGIEIIGLGFGSANQEFMEQISSQKNLAVITQLDELTSSFSKIAQVINSRSGGLGKL